ncbi:MAG: hypothetical protein NTV23_11720 [Propionibacteriales bacterium]|nr:hypothetical protein [Propionibacteriales bacterium]
MEDHDQRPGVRGDDRRLEIVEEFLSRIVGQAAAAELEMEHIVVCHDSETGAVTYSGPFADGLTALVFAEAQCRADRELNEGDQLRFSVAALHPGTNASAC